MTTKAARPAFPPRVVTSTRLFSYALAASVAFSLLPLPWGMAGLPFSILAFVLGIVALIAMRKGASTGLWTLMVVGMLLAGSLALNYGAAVVLYDELVAFQECNAGAITITAKDLCSREFEEAARERFEEFGVSLSWLTGSDS